ncbi:hypothetical protein V6Z11_D08G023100 [Gossypium hirsutum]
MNYESSQILSAIFIFYYFLFPILHGRSRFRKFRNREAVFSTLARVTNEIKYKHICLPHSWWNLIASDVTDLLSAGLENSMFMASCIADKISLLTLAEGIRRFGPCIALKSTA